MTAAIKRGNKIVVDTIDVPKPKSGQVLARVLHCGVCGSDLHAFHHLDGLIEAGQRNGQFWGKLDSSKDMVFGHEFCAEIVAFGPDTQKKLKEGDSVCAISVATDEKGLEVVGYSNRYPGGFGQYMVLTESMMFPVTNGVGSSVAALTEPTAVAVHAVAKADTANSVYMVIGCGPIGLAVVAELRARGFAPVIAVDFSAERRQLAEKLGADVVTDPAVLDPHSCWAEFGVAAGLFDFAESQANARRAVIFECVGAAGILNQIFTSAPKGAQLVVVGVCMTKDEIEPALAIDKELELRFSTGYTPDEFSATLSRICRGELDVSAMNTKVITLNEVAAILEGQVPAQAEGKIMVEFGSSA